MHYAIKVNSQKEFDLVARFAENMGYELDDEYTDVHNLVKFDTEDKNAWTFSDYYGAEDLTSASLIKIMQALTAKEFELGGYRVEFEDDGIRLGCKFFSDELVNELIAKVSKRTPSSTDRYQTCGTLEELEAATILAVAHGYVFHRGADQHTSFTEHVERYGQTYKRETITLTTSNKSMSSRSRYHDDPAFNLAGLLAFLKQPEAPQFLGQPLKFYGDDFEVIGYTISYDEFDAVVEEWKERGRYVEA